MHFNPITCRKHEVQIGTYTYTCMMMALRRLFFVLMRDQNIDNEDEFIDINDFQEKSLRIKGIHKQGCRKCPLSKYNKF